MFADLAWEVASQPRHEQRGMCHVHVLVHVHVHVRAAASPYGSERPTLHEQIIGIVHDAGDRDSDKARGEER